MKPSFLHVNIINIKLCLILFFFGFLFCIISLVNHYCFRTYALDLGLYSNALYDYARFQWNDSSVFKIVPENLLSDHFDLFLLLVSPLSYIFGTYTLLLLQILFILLGGIGIYQYVKLISSSPVIPLMAAIHFFLFFGIYSAVSYDFHSSVVAAMVVPWFFYFIQVRKIIRSVVVFLLILITKENSSLWMAFICMGLMISHRKIKEIRNALMIMSIVSLIYFVVIIQVVMPLFSNSGSYPHLKYSALGVSMKDLLSFILSHPLKTFVILFTNHTGVPEGNYVKAELHLFCFFSGAMFLVFRPVYLLMLLPVFFQKLLHDQVQMWGVNGQYAVEFAPVITLGVFDLIAGMKNKNFQGIVCTVVLVLTMAVTIRNFDRTYAFSNKERIRFYKKEHYVRDYDVKEIHHALQRIPAHVPVCAQSPYVPHLALRDHVYTFPVIRDAQFIVYSLKENPYPLTPGEFRSEIESLKQNPEWELFYENEQFGILQKKD